MIVEPNVERYMRALLDRHDEPVLTEMEAHAAEHGFPIVNRHAGVTLEILARTLGAQRVCELGSGYGYSGYWFARAGATEIHLTDGDPENATKAEDYLTRAGAWDRVTFHVGDAVTALNALPGEFDIIYCDIDKGDYPAAWRAAAERIRVGGLWICDNVLWSGRVAVDEVTDDVRPGWTEAIREMNTLIANDERYLSSIVPIRDGLSVAVRLR
jgi:caffeoyl-CoA O-methyltransferase